MGEKVGGGTCLNSSGRVAHVSWSNLAFAFQTGCGDPSGGAAAR